MTVQWISMIILTPLLEMLNMPVGTWRMPLAVGKARH